MDFDEIILERKEKILSGELEKKLNYFFNNKNLLLRALSHKSYIFYAKHKYFESNERLELLGDSVLSLIIIENLLEKYPESSEGIVSKLKAKIVSENALETIAKKFDLEKYLLLGRGEFNLGQNKTTSILADAVESLIGAIYKDSGIENARKFILEHFQEVIELCCEKNYFRDYKTKLQEYTQKKYKNKPIYKVLKEEGPEHNKTFYIEVKINNKIYGKGKGRNKKEAEQNAAKEALEKINNSNIYKS